MRSARLGVVVALAAGSLLGGGCRTVVDTVAGVLGPSGTGETIDAHVVYRLRPGCPTLLARTVDHGYTVLTPTEILGDAEADDVRTRDAFEGRVYEETGLFEGPVRPGTVVFRYIPPAESESWTARSIDVVATVEAVRLELPAAHDRMIDLCGPLEEGTEADVVPRLPVPDQR